MTSFEMYQCLIALALGATVVACSTEAPTYTRSDTTGTGPTVRYDLVAGLRSVPWPNDTLCWLDDDTTGPCLPNLPTATMTPQIADWVSAINTTRGWSTTGPIVLPLAPSRDIQSGMAIDLARLLALQQDSDWSNDAIYLVDLETGLPHTLEFPSTHGSFILQQPIELDPSDVHRDEPSLTAETLYEGADNPTLPHSSNPATVGGRMYRQDWDTDSDGALDVPTILPGHRCSPPLANNDSTTHLKNLRDRCLADEVIDAYDVPSNTLRLFPRAPLAQGRAYAIVVTDRLVDDDERVVQSPFASVSHPRQEQVRHQVYSWLGTPELSRYYGTVAEDPSRHVRFVWSFTTATPGLDLAERFQRWQSDLQESTHSAISIGTRIRLERHYNLDTNCPNGTTRSAMAALLRETFNLTPTEASATANSYGSVASVVIGTFSHPAYVEPGRLPQSGAAVDVPFWLTLPKNTTVNSPLRAIVVSHEQGGSQVDAMRWAGDWAKLGLATLGTPRTGSPSRPLELAAANVRDSFDESCSIGLLSDLTRPRSDAAQWSPIYRSDVDPDVVSTRDRWRFDAVELASLVQALDSRLEISDTIPDLLSVTAVALVGVGTGAATASLAASLVPHKLSLVMVDPATSPDRAWRRGVTWGAPKANLWHVFGPRIAGVPVTTLAAESTRCGANTASLRLVGADALGAGLEVGCLPLGDENGIGKSKNATAIATNLTTLSRRCVAVSPSGQFSLGIAAAANDPIELAIYNTLDVVVRLGRDADCSLVDDAIAPVFVLGGGTLNPADSSLVSSSYGLGFERQSSELLHALDLAAAAFAPTNPAPFVAQLTQPINPTDARGVLISVSPGDGIVPPDEGLTLARAARLVPRFPADSLNPYRELAADVTPGVASALTKPTAAARVEEGRLDEGAPRLARFPVNVSTCGLNLADEPASGSSCRMPTVSEELCAQYLPDLDALAGTRSGFGAQQPIPPLRLARYAGRIDFDNISELWSPQSRLIGLSVQPTHPDWPFVALALPLANPLGSHGIARDDVCQGFRFGTYMTYLLGQFVASGGTDYAPITHRDTQLCLANPQECTFLKFNE